MDLPTNIMGRNDMAEPLNHGGERATSVRYCSGLSQEPDRDQQQKEERDPRHVEHAADGTDQERSQQRCGEEWRDRGPLTWQGEEVRERTGHEQGERQQSGNTVFDEKLEIEVVDVPGQVVGLGGRQPVREPCREVAVVEKFGLVWRGKADRGELHPRRGVAHGQ